MPYFFPFSGHIPLKGLVKQVFLLGFSAFLVLAPLSILPRLANAWFQDMDFEQEEKASLWLTTDWEESVELKETLETEEESAEDYAHPEEENWITTSGMRLFWREKEHMKGQNQAQGRVTPPLFEIPLPPPEA